MHVLYFVPTSDRRPRLEFLETGLTIEQDNAFKAAKAADLIEEFFDFSADRSNPPPSDNWGKIVSEMKQGQSFYTPRLSKFILSQNIPHSEEYSGAVFRAGSPAKAWYTFLFIPTVAPVECFDFLYITSDLAAQLDSVLQEAVAERILISGCVARIPEKLLTAMDLIQSMASDFQFWGPLGKFVLNFLTPVQYSDRNLQGLGRPMTIKKQ